MIAFYRSAAIAPGKERFNTRYEAAVLRPG